MVDIYLLHKTGIVLNHTAVSLALAEVAQVAVSFTSSFADGVKGLQMMTIGS